MELISVDPGALKDNPDKARRPACGPTHCCWRRSRLSAAACRRR
ncbi:hypothetical protein [Mesorhizobium sp.]|nr:hypothetical protein [Mesorhizobium sp.]